MTQACEWKSSLFVPKSNDIHFAQPTTSSHSSSSSVSYSSPSAAQDSRQSPGSEQQNYNNNNNDGDNDDDDDSTGRTIFRTSSKALILALPIAQSDNFAGYEPGEYSFDSCSARVFFLSQLDSTCERVERTRSQIHHFCHLLFVVV